MLPNPQEAAYQFGWMAAKNKTRGDNPFQDTELSAAWQRGYTDGVVRLVKIQKLMNLHNEMLRELA